MENEEYYEEFNENEFNENEFNENEFDENEFDENEFDEEILEDDDEFSEEDDIEAENFYYKQLYTTLNLATAIFCDDFTIKQLRLTILPFNKNYFQIQNKSLDIDNLIKFDNLDNQREFLAKYTDVYQAEHRPNMFMDWNNDTNLFAGVGSLLATEIKNLRTADESHKQKTYAKLELVEGFCEECKSFEEQDTLHPAIMFINELIERFLKKERRTLSPDKLMDMWEKAYEYGPIDDNDAESLSDLYNRIKNVSMLYTFGLLVPNAFIDLIEFNGRPNLAMHFKNEPEKAFEELERNKDLSATDITKLAIFRQVCSIFKFDPNKIPASDFENIMYSSLLSAFESKKGIYIINELNKMMTSNQLPPELNLILRTLIQNFSSLSQYNIDGLPSISSTDTLKDILEVFDSNFEKANKTILVAEECVQKNDERKIKLDKDFLSRVAGEPNRPYEKLFDAFVDYSEDDGM